MSAKPQTAGGVSTDVKAIVKPDCGSDDESNHTVNSFQHESMISLSDLKADDDQEGAP